MNRIFSLLAICLLAISARAADRPNVVFIVSEDNSIHYLDLFFKGGSRTPNIERLAKEGLVFENAFSNSPVCSVARTTLATSCYGPRIGTQFHRKYKMAPMPGELKMFPAYLREAGYYTTNNSKKDYNAIEGKGVWDESSKNASWMNREDNSQPFFHMQSHGDTHESSLHFNQESFENDRTIHNPKSVQLTDYFPDTEKFRYTHARYLDNQLKIDRIVGATVSDLKAEGVLEDTFIFYFGDHGGVLPRGKGYIYESGLHVPLVVRVPENFKHLVDAERGTRHEGFVSFVDFGPTVLKLAGIEPAKGTDGKPFLGEGVKMEEVNARDEAFGYADRFDEKYEFLRSLRKGKFQYIRCYQNWLPDGLQNNYRYRMLAYEEWRTLFQEGKLNEAQAAFFKPKPVELLYDVEADPHEVNNLANDPAHAETLRKLRAALHEKVSAMPDLSFFPESFLVEHVLDENPTGYGKENQELIAELVDIADLALLPFEEAQEPIRQALDSEDEMKRMWGAMVCTAFGKEAAEAFGETGVKMAKGDPDKMIRVRAAEFVGVAGLGDPMPFLAEVINKTNNAVLATEALNSVVLFQDFYDEYEIDPAELKPAAKGDGVTRRIDYLNGEPYKSKPRKNNKAKK
ncbi:MAG: sulfatase-like hydrolase/transferase [Verrucomicrobiales bacterium]|nr:sulfatase-like hydrolase/transferase [Verrucomicrobiales bacterium]